MKPHNYGTAPAKLLNIFDHISKVYFPLYITTLLYYDLAKIIPDQPTNRRLLHFVIRNKKCPEIQCI